MVQCPSLTVPYWEGRSISLTCSFCCIGAGRLRIVFFIEQRRPCPACRCHGSLPVTLLMRPLGSAVFRALCGLHGRKRAMLDSHRWRRISTAPPPPAFRSLPTIRSVGVIGADRVSDPETGSSQFSRRRGGRPPTPSARNRSRPHWRGAMSGPRWRRCACIWCTGGHLVRLPVTSSIFPGDASRVGWRFMFFSRLAQFAAGVVQSSES